MKKSLIFLGTGASSGVPIIGCHCPVCLSNDSVNKRLRPSALLDWNHKKFLIDVGPDFRMQALEHHITHLDGILLTHAHYDHTAGIDDLRPIYFRRQLPLPILLSSSTAQELRIRYEYLFRPHNQFKDFIPRLHLEVLPSLEGKVIFEDLPIQYMSYEQGGMIVNGFRIGDFAYISDIRDFSSSLFENLKGVRYLIISALRYEPSPLHFSVDEAIEFAKKVKAEKVWLTHISHDLEHHEANAYLPSHIRLAYDGLQLELE